VSVHSFFNGKTVWVEASLATPFTEASLISEGRIETLGMWAIPYNISFLLYIVQPDLPMAMKIYFSSATSTEFDFRITSNIPTPSLYTSYWTLNYECESE